MVITTQLDPLIVKIFIIIIIKHLITKIDFAIGLTLGLEVDGNAL